MSNPRSRTKGKGKSYKDFNKKKFDDKESKIDSKKNDASWYTKNQPLVADSGKIAFTWPTGTPVDLNVPNPNNVGYHYNGRNDTKVNFPGVMALQYVPTYGVGHTGYDALNIAAQNVYTYVRHVQSGHANYDPTDLMLYLMAMDQIYSLYMHLCRAYGTIRLFSQKNRNLPRVIMNAMGFDYDDVANNLADFRYFINNAATRIGAMCVPSSMPVFYRHMWMPASIYTDGNSAKAQLYIFRPQAFGLYEEKTSTLGGYLSAQFMAYKHTVADWCQLLNDMISRVRNSEDCGIMSGDILKAFGDNVIKLPFITEDYITNVVYSEEVLGQIANATVMPSAVYKSVSGMSPDPMIYQDITDGVLKSNLWFRSPVSTGQPIDGYNIYLGKRIMVGLSESPTPDEVMVNSRLMVIGKEITNYPSNSAYIDIDSAGTEVVVEATMYDTDNMEDFYDATTPQMAAYQYLRYFDYQGTYGGGPTALTAMAKGNYFTLHPSFTVGSVSSGGDIMFNAYFDVDNYAILDAHDVAKMHETALLSMLDVPLLGSAK